MTSKSGLEEQSAPIYEGKPEYSFFAGGGEMGQFIRAYPWHTTPLGPPENWPQTLKTTLRLLLSTGHPMFLWWGPDLIQFYNDAYSRSLGPERHPSAIGQRGRECWEEVWPIVGHQIEMVMAGKGHTWNENQLVPTTRHGRREDLYWTYSFSPIDDPNAPNGVGGILVVCSETTEQVVAERRMQASEARWRALFTQAPGFICTLHGPDHSIEFANPRYHELVGGRDIIGKTVHEALPELEEQGFVALLDHVYSTGKAHSGVATPISFGTLADGSEQQVYINFVYQPILDREGKVTGILMDGYDVTEQVLARNALQEEARRKDEFLAMLAHELRNPLAPIGNASELLLRSADQDPQLQGIGDMLARQVKQLTRLVDDLLDISRITRGRVTLQRKPMELGDAVDLVINTMQQALQDKQHQLSYSPPDQALYINGDHARIVQSLSNLLNNAIKYTDNGGQIKVVLSRTNDMAMVEITDSGVGISPGMLNKVFDLFVQANRSLDRAQGGLGIGLSLVQRMVEMHGGSVRAYSKGLGKGSTFQVQFPLIDPPKQVAPTGVRGSLEPKRVLVVDDNKDAADSLAQLLQLQGHDAMSVYSAQSGLEQSESFRPEIILLDIGLPEIDGYQVARQLRAQNTPALLVALTGYGRAEDVQQSLEAGFDYHFTKPLAFGDLEQILSKKL